MDSNISETSNVELTVKNSPTLSFNSRSSVACQPATAECQTGTNERWIAADGCQTATDQCQAASALYSVTYDECVAASDISVNHSEASAISVVPNWVKVKEPGPVEDTPSASSSSVVKYSPSEMSPSSLHLPSPRDSGVDVSSPSHRSDEDITAPVGQSTPCPGESNLPVKSGHDRNKSIEVDAADIDSVKPFDDSSQSVKTNNRRARCSKRRTSCDCCHTPSTNRNVKRRRNTFHSAVVIEADEKSRIHLGSGSVEDNHVIRDTGSLKTTLRRCSALSSSGRSRSFKIRTKKDLKCSLGRSSSNFERCKSDVDAYQTEIIAETLQPVSLPINSHKKLTESSTSDALHLDLPLNVSTEEPNDIDSELLLSELSCKSARPVFRFFSGDRRRSNDTDVLRQNMLRKFAGFGGSVEKKGVNKIGESIVRKLPLNSPLTKQTKKEYSLTSSSVIEPNPTKLIIRISTAKSSSLELVSTDCAATALKSVPVPEKRDALNVFERYPKVTNTREAKDHDLHFTSSSLVNDVLLDLNNSDSNAIESKASSLSCVNRLYNSKKLKMIPSGNTPNRAPVVLNTKKQFGAKSDALRLALVGSNSSNSDESSQAVQFNNNELFVNKYNGQLSTKSSLLDKERKSKKCKRTLKKSSSQHRPEIIAGNTTPLRKNNDSIILSELTSTKVKEAFSFARKPVSNADCVVVHNGALKVINDNDAPVLCGLSVEHSVSQPSMEEKNRSTINHISANDLRKALSKDKDEPSLMEVPIDQFKQKDVSTNGGKISLSIKRAGSTGKWYVPSNDKEKTIKKKNKKKAHASLSQPTGVDVARVDVIRNAFSPAFSLPAASQPNAFAVVLPKKSPTLSQIMCISKIKASIAEFKSKIRVTPKKGNDVSSDDRSSKSQESPPTQTVVSSKSCCSIVENEIVRDAFMNSSDCCTEAVACRNEGLTTEENGCGKDLTIEGNSCPIEHPIKSNSTPSVLNDVSGIGVTVKTEIMPSFVEISKTIYLLGDCKKEREPNDDMCTIKQDDKKDLSLFNKPYDLFFNPSEVVQNVVLPGSPRIKNYSRAQVLRSSEDKWQIQRTETVNVESVIHPVDKICVKLELISDAETESISQIISLPRIEDNYDLMASQRTVRLKTDVSGLSASEVNSSASKESLDIEVQSPLAISDTTVPLSRIGKLKKPNMDKLRLSFTATDDFDQSKQLCEITGADDSRVPEDSCVTELTTKKDDCLILSEKNDRTLLVASKEACVVIDREPTKKIQTMVGLHSNVCESVRSNESSDGFMDTVVEDVMGHSDNTNKLKPTLVPPDGLKLLERRDDKLKLLDAPKSSAVVKHELESVQEDELKLECVQKTKLEHLLINKSDEPNSEDIKFSVCIKEATKVSSASRLETDGLEAPPRFSKDERLSSVVLIGDLDELVKRTEEQCFPVAQNGLASPFQLHGSLSMGDRTVSVEHSRVESACSVLQTTKILPENSSQTVSIQSSEPASSIKQIGERQPLILQSEITGSLKVQQNNVVAKYQPEALNLQTEVSATNVTDSNLRRSSVENNAELIQSLTNVNIKSEVTVVDVGSDEQSIDKLDVSSSVESIFPLLKEAICKALEEFDAPDEPELMPESTCITESLTEASFLESASLNFPSLPEGLVLHDSSGSELDLSLLTDTFGHQLGVHSSASESLLLFSETADPGNSISSLTESISLTEKSLDLNISLPQKSSSVSDLSMIVDSISFPESSLFLPPNCYSLPETGSQPLMNSNPQSVYFPEPLLSHVESNASSEFISQSDSWPFLDSSLPCESLAMLEYCLLNQNNVASFPDPNSFPELSFADALSLLEPCPVSDSGPLSELYPISESLSLAESWSLLESCLSQESLSLPELLCMNDSLSYPHFLSPSSKLYPSFLFSHSVSKPLTRSMSAPVPLTSLSDDPLSSQSASFARVFSNSSYKLLPTMQLPTSTTSLLLNSSSKLLPSHPIATTNTGISKTSSKQLPPVSIAYSSSILLPSASNTSVLSVTSSKLLPSQSSNSSTSVSPNSSCASDFPVTLSRMATRSHPTVVPDYKMTRSKTSADNSDQDLKECVNGRKSRSISEQMIVKRDSKSSDSVATTPPIGLITELEMAPVLIKVRARKPRKSKKSSAISIPTLTAEISSPISCEEKQSFGIENEVVIPAQACNVHSSLSAIADELCNLNDSLINNGAVSKIVSKKSGKRKLSENKQKVSNCKKFKLSEESLSGSLSQPEQATKSTEQPTTTTVQPTTTTEQPTTTTEQSTTTFTVLESLTSFTKKSAKQKMSKNVLKMSDFKQPRVANECNPNPLFLPPSENIVISKKIKNKRPRRPLKDHLSPTSTTNNASTALVVTSKCPNNPVPTLKVSKKKLKSSKLPSNFLTSLPEPSAHKQSVTPLSFLASNLSNNVDAVEITKSTELKPTLHLSTSCKSVQKLHFSIANNCGRISTSSTDPLRRRDSSALTSVNSSNPNASNVKSNKCRPLVISNFWEKSVRQVNKCKKSVLLDSSVRLPGRNVKHEKYKQFRPRAGSCNIDRNIGHTVKLQKEEFTPSSHIKDVRSSLLPFTHLVEAKQTINIALPQTELKDNILSHFDAKVQICDLPASSQKPTPGLCSYLTIKQEILCNALATSENNKFEKEQCYPPDKTNISSSYLSANDSKHLNKRKVINHHSSHHSKNYSNNECTSLSNGGKVRVPESGSDQNEKTGTENVRPVSCTLSKQSRPSAKYCQKTNKLFTRDQNTDKLKSTFHLSNAKSHPTDKGIKITPMCLLTDAELDQIDKEIKCINQSIRKKVKKKMKRSNLTDTAVFALDSQLPVEKDDLVGIKSLNESDKEKSISKSSNFDQIASKSTISKSSNFDEMAAKSTICKPPSCVVAAGEKRKAFLGGYLSAFAKFIQGSDKLPISNALIASYKNASVFEQDTQTLKKNSEDSGIISLNRTSSEVGKYLNNSAHSRDNSSFSSTINLLNINESVLASSSAAAALRKNVRQHSRIFRRSTLVRQMSKSSRCDFDKTSRDSRDYDCPSVRTTQDTDCLSMQITQDTNCPSVQIKQEPECTSVRTTQDTDFPIVQITQDTDCPSVQIKQERECSSLQITQDTDCFSVKLAQDTDCCGVEQENDCLSVRTTKDNNCLCAHTSLDNNCPNLEGSRNNDCSTVQTSNNPLRELEQGNVNNNYGPVSSTTVIDPHLPIVCENNALGFINGVASDKQFSAERRNWTRKIKRRRLRDQASVIKDIEERVSAAPKQNQECLVDLVNELDSNPINDSSSMVDDSMCDGDEMGRSYIRVEIDSNKGSVSVFTSEKGSNRLKSPTYEKCVVNKKQNCNDETYDKSICCKRKNLTGVINQRTTAISQRITARRRLNEPIPPTLFAENNIIKIRGKRNRLISNATEISRDEVNSKIQRCHSASEGSRPESSRSNVDRLCFRPLDVKKDEAFQDLDVTSKNSCEQFSSSHQQLNGIADVQNGSKLIYSPASEVAEKSFFSDQLQLARLESNVRILFSILFRDIICDGGRGGDTSEINARKMFLSNQLSSQAEQIIDYVYAFLTSESSAKHDYKFKIPTPLRLENSSKTKVKPLSMCSDDISSCVGVVLLCNRPRQCLARLKSKIRAVLNIALPSLTINVDDLCKENSAKNLLEIITSSYSEAMPGVEMTSMSICSPVSKEIISSRKCFSSSANGEVVSTFKVVPKTMSTHQVRYPLKTTHNFKRKSDMNCVLKSTQSLDAVLCTEVAVHSQQVGRGLNVVEERNTSNNICVAASRIATDVTSDATSSLTQTVTSSVTSGVMFNFAANVTPCLASGVTQASLIHASVTPSDVIQASVTPADVTQASFTKAIFTQTSFTQASLTQTSGTPASAMQASVEAMPCCASDE